MSTRISRLVDYNQQKHRRQLSMNFISKLPKDLAEIMKKKKNLQLLDKLMSTSSIPTKSPISDKKQETQMSGAGLRMERFQLSKDVYVISNGKPTRQRLSKPTGEYAVTSEAGSKSNCQSDVSTDDLNSTLQPSTGMKLKGISRNLKLRRDKSTSEVIRIKKRKVPLSHAAEYGSDISSDPYKNVSLSQAGKKRSPSVAKALSKKKGMMADLDKLIDALISDL
mmetsp:Transcript_8576/g.9727  ORF Transcript_8576/g.9727 Transcript_8576/m.9727 type:complete len:223 (-) Transcript_8576:24-692(-)|eukprot:CAMPEP_0168332010 /NCGR_PEP_ID=MMETSP0213-20121227/8696_1 /TAXON_ID=151035 /ORGANISM="Euplotes harpa, Strain FSP1.4" /LENGTH=222 /DNA_ID=CAMNT_0008335939 /DNA_START=502 /DNA_END=1170 /DNA_ORIENTATION=+